MAVPSIPAFHVTGPVHHLVRFTGDTNVYYLGTAEVTPKVEERVFYQDVFNDIGGRMVPMQRTEQGEMAVIGVLLNRFSKSTYYRMRNLGASILPGWRSRLSRGTLAFGNNSFELWLLFENATIPAFATPGLELGYYFPQVLLAGKTRDTLGTEAEKLMLVMEAYPFFVPQSNSGGVGQYERSFRLYSTEAGSFPGDVLIPQ